MDKGIQKAYLLYTKSEDTKCMCIENGKQDVITSVVGRTEESCQSIIHRSTSFVKGGEPSPLFMLDIKARGDQVSRVGKGWARWVFM